MCSDGMLEQMDNDQLVALLSSQLTDEEKRNKLIELTKGNQDNHSAWIIHIKDVIKEEGDSQLENEEPTACCNAINIMPQIVGKDVVDEDDVVIVEKGEKKNEGKSLLQKLKEAVFSIMNIKK